MKTNDTIEIMLNRKSIRKYEERPVDDETLEAMVRAAFQAPFAAQLGSLLLSRNSEKNPFGAPLLFTVCVDCHRLELIMAERGWRMKTSDAAMLIFGVQDACYMAENLVVAAESFGMGSCFLGGAPFVADRIAEQYSLPERVFPVVQLVVGYPALRLKGHYLAMATLGFGLIVYRLVLGRRRQPPGQVDTAKPSG